jgi:hypothetical protein
VTRQFNLLPARYAERVAERQLAARTAVGLAVLLAVLAIAGFHQSRRLTQAEQRRDAEQARNAELQARRRQLQPFRQLADGIIGRERLLTAGMETQVSWATVLSSLSQSFPADASLTSFTATSTLPAFGAVPPVKPGHQGSVREFTPGVDRMLELLASVVGLAEPRLEVASADKIGARSVTTFEGGTFVDAQALTGRYAQGLPPEVDVDLPVTARAAAAPPPASGNAPRPPE